MQAPEGSETANAMRGLRGRALRLEAKGEAVRKPRVVKIDVREIEYVKGSDCPRYIRSRSLRVYASDADEVYDLIDFALRAVKMDTSKRRKAKR